MNIRLTLVPSILSLLALVACGTEPPAEFTPAEQAQFDELRQSLGSRIDQGQVTVDDSYVVGQDCAMGLSQPASGDMKDCCEDAGCMMDTDWQRLGGELCVIETCDCGAGTMDGGWNVGDMYTNWDDWAFLECANDL